MYTSNERIALVEGMVDLLDLVGLKQNRAKKQTQIYMGKSFDVKKE
ncbi:MAG: hypothetical protein MGU50_15600 [Trichodesmium sp. MAG_R02]|jgi:hypothetical protein|nr:hypothetical protein [Trichodesmium sp. MAG_R02]